LGNKIINIGRIAGSDLMALLSFPNLAEKKLPLMTRFFQTETNSLVSFPPSSYHMMQMLSRAS